jgi:hypothetical protein
MFSIVLLTEAESGVPYAVDRVAIGLRGRITFEPLQDDAALPQFAAHC